MSTATIDIGKMRERVEIQHALETQGDGGEVARSWVCLSTRWAQVVPVSAREVFAADKTEAVSTHRMVLRYTANVTTKNRIKWGNRIFGIDAVIDINARERFIELLCREAV